MTFFSRADDGKCDHISQEEAVYKILHNKKTYTTNKTGLPMKILSSSSSPSFFHRMKIFQFHIADHYCRIENVRLFVVENLCNLKAVLDTGGKGTVSMYPIKYADLTGLPCRVVMEE